MILVSEDRGKSQRGMSCTTNAIFSWKSAIRSHWLSIMHNHSLPKEYLATWNRTETARKAVREVNILLWFRLPTPYFDGHMFMKFGSSLDFTLRRAIDDFRWFPTNSTRISGDLVQYYNSRVLVRNICNAGAWENDFYIGWAKVTTNYMARQLWGQ